MFVSSCPKLVNNQGLCAFPAPPMSVSPYKDESQDCCNILSLGLDASAAYQRGWGYMNV